MRVSVAYTLFSQLFLLLLGLQALLTFLELWQRRAKRIEMRNFINAAEQLRLLSLEKLILFFSLPVSHYV